MVSRFRRLRAAQLGLVLFCVACAHTPPQHSLYDRMGGHDTVTAVTEQFIRQIEFDRTIFPYFAETNVDRFRSMFIEHLCAITGGPCTYTGDDMGRVHRGMNISETDFNRTVELLINAMDLAGVAHRHQNLILRKLAPMRADIVYQ